MDTTDLARGIDLTGQAAIVTGGGRGIGRAIALALSRAGAAVAVVSRTKEQLAETVVLVEEEGGQGMAFPADVTDRQAVEQMVSEVEQELGPVDLLVNNAGHATETGPFWEVEPEEWWRCIEINLRGPYLCTRAVVPGMINRRQGRIIITASGAGRGPWSYMSAYAISKCAVIRLTENFAAETRELGVSVFAISPGLVRTVMTEAATESPADERWLGGLFRNLLSEGSDIPPEHAAQLVVFLASGRANGLSRCFVTVDDDVEEMVAHAHEIQENSLYTLRLHSLDS